MNEQKTMNDFNDLLKAQRNNNKYSDWFKTQQIIEHHKELLDEVEEVVAAINNNDMDNLEEELGDALWDMIGLIAIAEREHGLKFENVVDRVVDKFKERKPHLFEEKLVSIDEEREVWNKAKAMQKERAKVIRNE
ncbi:hypothetical protein C0585_01475 [Candidatus Woesearchaeota archaeon]|nr:MAG: hypothetical protein C0585_01475 [Candidatus Woesearchaeota archaeon]